MINIGNQANSKKYIRGYDLDGVLAGTNKPKKPKSYFEMNGDERKAYQKKTKEAYREAQLIRHPKRPYHIITSRRRKYRDVTIWWCEKHDLKPETINTMDRPRTQQNMIEFKREKAKELNVDIFYEDDKTIAKNLLGNGFKVKWVRHI